MKRRPVLTPVTLGFALLLISLSSAFSATQPNIIVILLDDLGYSDLGAYGGEIHTPHIDQLAGNGLRFTQAYNAARCCPSRAALMSGLYSHQAGLADFTGPDRSEKMGPAYQNRLGENCVTLARVLKDAGYQTYHVGKWHLHGKVNPIDRGFDEFFGYTHGHSQPQWDPALYQRLPEGRKPERSYRPKEFYATDVFNDYAVEFIEQSAKSEAPFFLYLAHSSPHFPLHAPAATRDKYIETYRQGWDALRKKRYQRQQEIGLAEKTWTLTELSDVPIDPQEPTNGYAGKQNPHWDDLDKLRKEDLAHRMAIYAAMVEHVDIGIGRMIKTLQAQGELDNTLIMLTSDNGACYEWGPFGFDVHNHVVGAVLHEARFLVKMGLRGSYHSVGSGWANLSNTPFRLYKHYNHEGGNCSPLIAHWPQGIQNPDRWVRTPVHLIDFMPTLLEASGASYPKEVDGRTIQPYEGSSLKPIFAGADKLPERTLYFDHFGSSAIRKGDWKLVRCNVRLNDRKWELYNIAADRCETKDLISSKPELSEALEADWVEWAKRVKLSEYYSPHERAP
jgi:arylsulfatase